MADREAFGEEEWAAVLRAPFLVGLLIATASPSGMLGSLKEAFAAKKLLIETRANGMGVNGLIDLVLAELDTDEGRARADLTHLANLVPAEIRKEAERSIQAAGEAARAHAPAEAPGFQEWLLTLAHAVATASKRGRIFRNRRQAGERCGGSDAGKSARITSRQERLRRNLPCALTWRCNPFSGSVS
ncbi:MAG: hypothetical protein QM758_17815 [Armatimonas sp.]